MLKTCLKSIIRKKIFALDDLANMTHVEEKKFWATTLVLSHAQLGTKDYSQLKFGPDPTLSSGPFAVHNWQNDRQQASL